MDTFCMHEDWNFLVSGYFFWGDKLAFFPSTCSGVWWENNAGYSRPIFSCISPQADAYFCISSGCTVHLAHAARHLLKMDLRRL